MTKHIILEKLENLELSEQELAFVWLGQNGFLIRYQSLNLLFDPYLSDFAEQWTAGTPNQHVRMSAIPIEPKDIQGIDYVLCSHDHVDHIDPFTIPIVAQRNPDAVFIAPEAARKRLEGLYVNPTQLGLLRGLDSKVFQQISVYAIPAAHSDLDYNHDYGYPYLSFIVRLGKITLFFAGDTVPYVEQLDYIKPFDIDIAFLPINGQKSPEYNLEPNFSIEEAIDFATAINAKTTIPMHYNMFTINTVDINDFVLAAKDKIQYKLPQIGVPIVQKVE